MSYEKSKDLFLGFDLSTQQLKIIATNENLEHLETFHVEFDDLYKEKYGIKKGVISNDETGEIVSPVAMWLDALDTIFGKMKEKEFPFNKVRGISGSGQQHGSVYWSNNAPTLMQDLNTDSPLSEQLKDAFTFENSPNWQDHSTGEEIKTFEEAVGGSDQLADITGSRAHYRFTGLQIRKLAVRTNPSKYKETYRISLVSSFMASVLLGEITNIEQAEACGMNLYDIKKNDYDDELLSLAAGVHPTKDGATKEQTKAGVSELKKKLGEIKPISYENSGDISPYFVNKYGFNSDVKIYSFTGDNLATIISLPLAPNDILTSLGTSTTVLLITENYIPSSQYHLFKHPTMPNNYMGMICYCNGSLAREKIRDSVNEKNGVKDSKSWDKFNELLDSSDTFNNELGIYFPLGEIVPNASAQYKRCKLDDQNKLITVDSWDVEEDVSSIVESQTLSCRLRAGPMISSSGSANSTPSPESSGSRKLYQDLHQRFGDLYTDGKKQTFESLTSRPHKVFFVGGASNNISIVKKMGSILGPTDGNYKVEIPNACALGGAYKASWSHHCESEEKWINYDTYINKYFNFKELDTIKVKDHWQDYFTGMGMLAKMEQELKHD